MIPQKVNNICEKQLVIDHFLRMGKEDLRLRFGYQITDDYIIKYINDTWYSEDDQWFAVFESPEKVIATVHVSKYNNEAEMGCTVEEEYRNMGLGNALFRRGATWANRFGIRKIYMHCLSENEAIQKIAKKNSMSVVTIGQGEKEAKVTLPFIDFTAPYRDAAYDRMAIYDTIIRNQKWIFERMFNLEH